MSEKKENVWKCMKQTQVHVRFLFIFKEWSFSLMLGLRIPSEWRSVMGLYCFMFVSQTRFSKFQIFEKLKIRRIWSWDQWHCQRKKSIWLFFSDWECVYAKHCVSTVLFSNDSVKSIYFCRFTILRRCCASPFFHARLYWCKSTILMETFSFFSTSCWLIGNSKLSKPGHGKMSVWATV